MAGAPDAPLSSADVAKDTEKLIRQLSLISFLMANGRPGVGARDQAEVEGYSSMNEDAFARRFYADRAELESLGISLQVEKPGEGFFEAELYALPPENYYLPAIEFTDDELAALRTALAPARRRVRLRRAAAAGAAAGLLGPAEPARASRDAAPVDVSMAAVGGGRELSQRLSKIETAISRRKTIEFSYYTMERDEVSDRKVDPYHLVFRGGQFYLIGHSHERDAVRVFRLSRIRGKVSYATKAEHDFPPPEDFDRRDYAHARRLADGRDRRARAKIFLRERIAWLVERDFGALRRDPQAGQGRRRPGQGHRSSRPTTPPRASWSPGCCSWRENATRARARRAGRGGRAERLRAAARAPPAASFDVAETVARPLAERNGRGAPLATAAPSRRSAPSASPAWSRSPGC